MGANALPSVFEVNLVVESLLSVHAHAFET